MANELEKMSTVNKTKAGVEVRVQGEVQKEKIDTMIQGCATGTHACCGPEFFAKVKNIEVGGEDGDVSIHIQGDVTEDMIKHNLANCDCYKP